MTPRRRSSCSRALRAALAAGQPAIDKVNKGEYGDAVTAARRALDAMGAGWASEKDIASVDKAQRSLDGGGPRTSARLFIALVADCERILGAKHPDTLTSRGHVAAWTAQAGELGKAYDQNAELLPAV